MSLTDLGAFLNLVIGGVVVAVVTAMVAAYRRIKAGAIVDDDALIARLDGDNVKLRKSNSSLIKEVEKERAGRWKAEECAERWRRQLVSNNIEPSAIVGDESR